MFIATPTKKAATVTCYILNIIEYWHFVKKENDVMKIKTCKNRFLLLPILIKLLL